LAIVDWFNKKDLLCTLSNFMERSTLKDDELWARALGLTVRDLRKTARLTQEQLAHELGITRNHMQKVERATTRVTFTTLIALANGLGINLVELLASAQQYVNDLPRMEDALKQLEAERLRGRPRKDDRTPAASRPRIR